MYKKITIIVYDRKIISFKNRQYYYSLNIFISKFNIFYANMLKKQAESKVTVRKSGGKGYGSTWIYIPSKLVKDSSFPFEENDPLKIEIVDDKLLIRKKEAFKDTILDYGLDNATLPRFLELKAKENANKIFIQYNNTTYSYSDTNIHSNRVAHGLIDLLKELGLKKCQIAVMLPNHPVYIFSWFGILKAGCTFVPIDLYSKGSLLKYILDHSDSKILFIDYKFLKYIEDFKAELIKLKKIIVANAPKDFSFNTNLISFQEIYSKIEKNPKIKLRYYHNMEIFYPSRFTQVPKGIILQHFFVLAGLLAAEVMKEIEPQKSGTFFAPLPLYHAEVRLLVVLSAMFLNLSITIVEKFNVATFWNDIKKYDASCFYFLGVLITLLINQPPSENDRNHPLKWAFGPEIPIETWKVFENRFGVKLYNLWSREECIPLTFNREGSFGDKIGSAGTPFDLFKIKIVDQKGNILPPGPHNVGEIVAQFEIPVILKFFKPTKDQENKFTKDGWVYTGDLGYMDNEGFLYYSGQREDLIEIDYRIINVFEIEKVANQHPFIFESAAFGVFNENKKCNEIKICIVLREEGIIVHETIFQYLRENLAYFMVPRYIEFKTQLRTDVTEYINKYYLKEEFNNEEIKRNTWDSFKKEFLQK